MGVSGRWAVRSCVTPGCRRSAGSARSCCRCPSRGASASPGSARKPRSKWADASPKRRSTVNSRRTPIGPLVDSPIVVAPLSYAQEMTGLGGRVTRVLVACARGSEAKVRAALARIGDGRLAVEPTSYDERLFSRAAAASNQSTVLFAVISALVGFLFAFNAMLLTVPQRRRLIVGLRRDGYTPRAVIAVVAARRARARRSRVRARIGPRRGALAPPVPLQPRLSFLRVRRWLEQGRQCPQCRAVSRGRDARRERRSARSAARHPLRNPLAALGAGGSRCGRASNAMAGRRRSHMPGGDVTIMLAVPQLAIVGMLSLTCACWRPWRLRWTLRSLSSGTSRPRSRARSRTSPSWSCAPAGRARSAMAATGADRGVRQRLHRGRPCGPAARSGKRRARHERVHRHLGLARRQLQPADDPAVPRHRARQARTPARRHGRARIPGRSARLGRASRMGDRAAAPGEPADTAESARARRSATRRREGPPRRLGGPLAGSRQANTTSTSGRRSRCRRRVRRRSVSLRSPRTSAGRPARSSSTPPITRARGKARSRAPTTSCSPAASRRRARAARSNARSGQARA